MRALKRSGRPAKLAAKDVAWAERSWKKAVPVERIMRSLNVSRATLYRYADLYDFGPHPLGHHEYLLRGRRNDPVPTIWACRCGGRCDRPEGHPQCA